MTERILILDFGSQYTQLIARRVREAGVYSEILPCTADDVTIRAFAPQAIILSGGPASTTEAEAPSAPAAVFELGVPILGICYGEQTICAQLGGKVEIGHHREFGRAFIDVQGRCDLFEGVLEPGAREQVWMSHGDKIVDLPPGFRVVATSRRARRSPRSPTTPGASTACSSTPRSRTRRAARPCSRTSFAGSPAAMQSGRWPRSGRRQPCASASRSAAAG